MANIRAARRPDASEFWATGLWRAVLPSLLLLGAVGTLHWQAPSPGDFQSDSSQNADELEWVMLGVLDPMDPW